MFVYNTHFFSLIKKSHASHSHSQSQSLSQSFSQSQTKSQSFSQSQCQSLSQSQVQISVSGPILSLSLFGKLKITLFNCFRPPSISLPFFCLGILCLPVCVHFFGIWGDLHWLHSTGKIQANGQSRFTSASIIDFLS